MADEHAGENSNPESDKYTQIMEGKAIILFPNENNVFYNNVQVFNRDTSIGVIKRFLRIEKEKYKKGIKILEALSATGLRATRYALEISDISEIVANDLSQDAVININRNIEYNNVGNIVKASHKDASLLMYENRFPLSKRYQVIDLDPYGSPCLFLDGAVQAIDEGGLLCITCTDMGGLCGNHGEAAYAKYGSVPLKARYCHEMALRIVLASVDSHASRYKRYIKPLLSLSADFYIRIFVQVFTSASEVKRSASKKSYVFHCNGCETFHLQPVGKANEIGTSKKYNPAIGPVVPQKCTECNSYFKIGGPVWSLPIHDLDFVTGMLADIREEKQNYATFQRIEGTLSLVLEELADQPFYYVLDNLCNILHATTPSHLQFRSALLHARHKVSSTHANQSGIKTDAPPSVIWDILRCWVEKQPVNEKKLTANSPATAILSKKATIVANFDAHPEAVSVTKKLKLLRFPENPETDWGPKARAKQSSEFSNLADKRKSLQGKRKKMDNKDPNFHKQFACKRLKKGECDLGDDCKYSHEITKQETNT